MSRRVVLITGASGFVGRSVSMALAGRGFDAHGVGRGFDRRFPGDWHSADLWDAATRRRLLKTIKPTHLVHCAWETRHGSFWSAPENLSWVAVTLELLREFVDEGGSRFILVGSCAEYEWPSSQLLPLREGDPCRPRTLYGEAKLAAHTLTARYAQQAGISWAVARLFHLIGPGDDANRLVPSIARALVAGQPAAIRHGELVRDYLDIRDAGRALAAITDHDAVGPINIGSGSGATLGSIGRNLARLAGHPDLVKVTTESGQSTEPLHLVANTMRLTDEIGFTSFTSLDSSLAEVVDYYRSELLCPKHTTTSETGCQLVETTPESVEAAGNLRVTPRRGQSGPC